MNRFLFLIRCFPWFVGSHFFLIRCFLRFVGSHFSSFVVSFDSLEAISESVWSRPTAAICITHH